MFTKRKKNYKALIYTILIVILCIFIGVLLWPQSESLAEEIYNEKKDIDQDVKVIQEIQDIQGITEKQESYYIVKKDGEEIAVYFSDEKGSVIKLESTSILYDLLPPDDQLSFEDGIKVKSQEELSALLQDFES